MAAPSGWPRTLSLGIVDSVDGAAGVCRRVGVGGLAYACFGGDAAARKDWSRDPARSPARFARDAQRQGLLPHASTDP